MTIARTILCSIALLAWIAACGSGEEEGAAHGDSEAAAAAEPAAEAESTPEVERLMIEQ